MAAANTNTSTGDGLFDELIAVNEQRVNTYSMLARLYAREVDQAYLDKLRAARWPVATGNEDADEGYRLLASYLSNTWEGSVHELEQEYVRCFMGKGKNSYSCAYPFESVNRSPKRLLRQDNRDEVLAVYRSEGLDKSSTWKEEEDHISVELEFMQIMATRSTKAMKEGNEIRALKLFATQRSFMNEHLITWTPTFTTDLRKFATSKFYLALASITDGFLKVDKDFLDGLVPRA